jgi:hypothetical protein
MMQIQVPPGFTQEQFEKLLEEHTAQNILKALAGYLKRVADRMDKNGFEYLTAADLRRIALEMTTDGYQPQ